jgi:two-component system, NarL family, response regulator LiaR
MKKYWTNIILYGLSLGLLLVALQFFQYKWVIVKNAAEWYVGFIAMIFSVVGIWAGIKWANKKTEPTALDVAFQVPEAVMTKLGITPRENSSSR